ncbi:MAG TPA: outer membrane lipoprotein carrier protein LolA [Polyangiaceae bacterium]|nr:outer membrane lipoprotein carrier protein LolA [Polyangiaceae bacterium]
MKRRVWLIVGAVMLASAAPMVPRTAGAQAAPAGSIGPEQIADRVQAFYDKTRTFTAGFKQLYIPKFYPEKKKESQGQVIFQKPGKMSWRYSNNGNRVVSDGKVIKVYEKENKQMYEQAMAKSQYPAALAFLVGGGNLKKEFRLRKLNAKEMGFEGGYVLLAEPKEPTPAYQKMLLYVDAGTHQVRRVLLLDAQGNRNRFDFVNPVVNKNPPANEFKFTPPPGTQVIKP